MGATYTRQSTYSDGDIITAAHTNDEFNQLLAAFASGTGHTHDGTTAEGGPITKLLGNTLTFGAGTAGTDITITFDGESNDGVLKWMEDEDYFEFSDDILIASTEKIQFRDTAISINSSTDGQLDLVADTEIQLAATTIDINGNVDISGTLTIGSAGISEAELEILDGATVTTAELNIMDGDTSATSTTVADADRVVMNDNGTMVQVAVTDLAAYFDDEITAMPNLVTTAATTVGALDSGSITSGFGNIDTGSSTITTTGLITGGSLDIDDVVINGTTIGHTDDTDLITLADGVVTVAGEISVTTLDIGGTNVTATATELNLLDGVSGLVQADFTKLAAVDSTAAELNIVDGGTSATSTTLADADRVVVNDNGTMVQVALTDFETYFESALDTLSNVTTVGALNSGSITSGFGAIDNGSSAITTTGTVTYGSLSDGSITITAFVDEDDMSSNSATLVPTQQSVKAYVDAQITAEDLDVTTDSGTIDIDLDSETLTIAGGTGLSSSASSTTVTMAVDAAQTGITSVVNSSLEIGRDADNRIKFGTDNQIIFEVDGGDNVIFKTSGEIEASSLDISGDADIDGTLEADAITVNGTALNTVIAGVTVTNATTAAVATTVTISDNESTDEDNAIIFTSGGDVDGGNIGLESDGDLTYNPSTGRLTATQLSGTLQTAAQGNVTSLGTLTTLTVDNVIINGSTIGHTGDTDLMTVASGVLTVAGEVDATSLDISGDADIDGTLEADAITVNGTALNTVIGNEATALAIALG